MGKSRGGRVGVKGVVGFGAQGMGVLGDGGSRGLEVLVSEGLGVMGVWI